MAKTRDQVHAAVASMESVWVPPPASERAGPTPLQLIWTLMMVVFMAVVFIVIFINLA